MTDCSICLENIETDMFVTKCGHKFHKNCSEQLKASGHHKASSTSTIDILARLFFTM